MVFLFTTPYSRLSSISWCLWAISSANATIKPSKFWEEIIEYSRKKNPEFLYLAEASDSWREPPSKYAEFTPYDKLLAAGFDGYYGSFFNLK